MKINPLLEIKTAANPKPNTQKFSQVVHSVNVRMERQHYIQESPSTQRDITEPVFNKLTNVNELIEKKDLAKYLRSLEIQKMSELQNLKTRLNELVTSKNNNEIVNDLIGG